MACGDFDANVLVISTARAEKYVACKLTMQMPYKMFVALLLQNTERTYFVLSMDRQTISRTVLVRYHISNATAARLLAHLGLR
jgi:hypothetical protein